MGKRLAKNSRSRLGRRARRWAWMLAALLLLGGGVGYLALMYGWTGVAGIGEQAPGFVLEDGEGRTVDLGDYLGRKPVVLVFYMTYT